MSISAYFASRGGPGAAAPRFSSTIQAATYRPGEISFPLPEFPSPRDRALTSNCGLFPPNCRRASPLPLGRTPLRLFLGSLPVGNRARRFHAVKIDPDALWGLQRQVFAG